MGKLDTYCVSALDLIIHTHLVSMVDEEDLIEKENAEEVKKRAKSAAYKQGSWFSPGVEAPQDENEDMTVLKMMRKRLDANKREMAMLFFTMNGSERFFKDIRSPAV